MSGQPPLQPQRDTLNFPQFSPALHDNRAYDFFLAREIRGCETVETQQSVTSARWRKDNNNISKVALNLSSAISSQHADMFMLTCSIKAASINKIDLPLNPLFLCRTNI